MASKGLFLLFMCIFTNSVTSLLNENSRQVRRKKDVEPRYNFNHPPSAEYYNPIPVDVIYEKESDYSGKSEDRTELDQPDENTNVNVTKEENEQPTSKEQANFRTAVSVSNFVNKTKAETVSRPRTSKKSQIPVTVVYESNTKDKINYQRTKTDTATETSKRHQNYSRKVQNKTNVDSQKTLNVDTEKPQTNVETRTFKKRTEGRSPVVPIIESENYVFSHNGNFHYSYEAGDGTKAYSEGKLKTVDEEAGEAVVGGFSYTDKDGNDFSLSYTADENGYRPVGDHLPTPPPIPPAIARALAYLATATPEPVTKPPVKSKPLIT